MYALIENNTVTQVGELSILFPNTSNPTAEFAQEQGALEVVEGEQKDQRFYWVTFSHYEVANGVVTRIYTNTPKAIEDNGETKGLKSQLIAQAKVNANSQLAQTDWYVIRKAERGVDIPADVATKRAAILAECDAVINVIQSATTVEQLM